MATMYELAYQVWPILTKVALKGESITYMKIATRLGYPTANPIRHPLAVIQEYCIEKEFPPLTILVVNDKSGKPGSGFIAWLGDLEQGRQRVFNFEWDKIEIPFPPETRIKLEQTLTRRDVFDNSKSTDFAVDDQEVRINGRGPYQEKYRKTLLHIYRGQCALCKTKYQPLLVASHIIPWSVDPQNRLNPKNGILFCRNHDSLFEKGLIKIDTDYSVSWPNAKKDNLGSDLFHFVTKRTKAKLILPRSGYEPIPDFLKWRILNIQKDES